MDNFQKFASEVAALASRYDIGEVWVMAYYGEHFRNCVAEVPDISNPERVEYLSILSDQINAYLSRK